VKSPEAISAFGTGRQKTVMTIFTFLRAPENGHAKPATWLLYWFSLKKQVVVSTQLNIGVSPANLGVSENAAVIY
jgi:hypothetical protein